MEIKQNNYLVTLGITLVLLLSFPILGQSNLEPGSEENLSEIVQSDVKINDSSSEWWSWRSSTAQNGLEIELAYIGEVWSNSSGGYGTKSDYLHNIDLVFAFDLEEFMGWQGATFTSYFLGNYGGVPSESAGAAQGISNIAADDEWKLYEIWIEQNLFSDKLSILFGLFDLNSEFDSREASALFINPSHGIGADFAQTGLNGPSIFPNASLALRLKYQIHDNFYLRTALFDGVPDFRENPSRTIVKLCREDGALSATEFVYESDTKEFEKGYSKAAVGGWYYTTEFEEFSSDAHKTRNGSYGFYAFAETFLYSEPFNRDQGLAGFLRVGSADDKVNPFDQYWGGGIIYKGPFEGRDDDIFGAAFAYVRTGRSYRECNLQNGIANNNFELALEVTYSYQVLPWIALQPDIQYVVHPGAVDNINNSLVFGLRTAIDF